VKAAEEELVEVRGRAWRLRAAASISATAICRPDPGDCILIRDDHVIVGSRGLGALVRKVRRSIRRRAYGQHNHDPRAARHTASLHRPPWLSRSTACWPVARLSDQRLQLQPASRPRSSKVSSRPRSLATWLQTAAARHRPVDGALFAAAWRAATADWPAFDAIAERAAAWRGTSEMALESRQQGGSFLSMTRKAWPHPALDAAHQRLAGELSLPVAVALAAAAHGIALELAIEGYLHAFTANLISAAVRTVPLGQSDGQVTLAALEETVLEAAHAAIIAASLDEVGTATPLLDWCSLRHETQYTRLFRS
jgi:urease accessory protein